MNGNFANILLFFFFSLLNFLKSRISDAVWKIHANIEFLFIKKEKYKECNSHALGRILAKHRCVHCFQIFPYKAFLSKKIIQHNFELPTQL